MRYNVAQLLKEPIGSYRTYHLEEEFTGPQRNAEMACGPVRMLRTHHGILVRGTVKIWSTLMCSRCLGEFASSTELSIEEEFFPTLDPQTSRIVSPPEDADQASLIDNSHILDFTRTLNDYIFTGLPMKPLCSPDCYGLCQVCGVNQNLGNCDCATHQKDPRWRALAHLTQEQEV